jgi:hypothetical protein
MRRWLVFVLGGGVVLGVPGVQAQLPAPGGAPGISPPAYAPAGPTDLSPGAAPGNSLPLAPGMGSAYGWPASPPPAAWPGAVATPPLPPSPGSASNGPPVLSQLGPTAFEETRGPREGWFLDLGSRAYQRQRPAHIPIGQADPGVPITSTITVPAPVTFSNDSSLTTVTVPVQAVYTTSTFPDTGNPPPASAPFIGDYHDLNPGLAWGFAGALGYRFEHSSFELSGFYIPDNRASVVDLWSNALSVPVPVTINQIVSIGKLPTAPGAVPVSVDQTALANNIAAQVTPQAQPGRIDLPFFNAPPGFEGDNGLWRQADHVQVSFRSTLGNIEANYRYWTSELVQFLVGLRYLEEKEDLDIFTQDDVLSSPDPTRDALYRVITYNRLVVGQLGFQGEYPLAKFLGVGLFAQGGWGANFLTARFLLARGDGLIGFDTERNTTVFSQIYELGVFANLYLTERCRLHAGYNMLWLVGIAEAVNQVDYDLSHTTGTGRDHSSLFYHGPAIELQFLF